MRKQKRPAGKTRFPSGPLSWGQTGRLSAGATTGGSWMKTGQPMPKFWLLACQKLDSWRLIDCNLFVTLEPCAMCAGAIINSRIKEVYFAAMDPKAGAAGSVVDLFSVEKFNHHPKVIRGLYKEQGAQLLKDFFREIRRKQKLAKKAQENCQKD